MMCSQTKNDIHLKSIFRISISAVVSIIAAKIVFVIIASLFLFVGSIAQANEIENKFVGAGLVDVRSIDNTIQVDLVNSDPKKNYFRENYYNGLNKAYLRKEVAIKLAKAQKILKQDQLKFSLLILDAARPRSVSKMTTGSFCGWNVTLYPHIETGSPTFSSLFSSTIHTIRSDYTFICSG